MLCSRVQHVSIVAALATIVLGGTTAAAQANELRERSLARKMDRVCIDEERRVGIETPKTVEGCSNMRLEYRRPLGVDDAPGAVPGRAGAGVGIGAENGLGRERSAAARERGNGGRHANNGFGNGGGDGVPGRSDKSDVDR